MTVRFYVDHHVNRAITEGLRAAGFDCLTTTDDHTEAWADPALLDRALDLGRVLVTFDSDFLALADARLGAGTTFASIVFVKPSRVTIGRAVTDLQAVAGGLLDEEHVNLVVHVPL